MTTNKVTAPTLTHALLTAALAAVFTTGVQPHDRGRAR